VFLKHIWKCLVGKKRAYHNLEKSRFQEVLLSKTNSTLKGNNELDAAASNIDRFFWTDMCISTPH
jgi:hypothetical protein